ncbi:glutathionine S-transferase [Salmonella enterica subsp. enterica serovar Wandsworth str. A4-580]|uniref:Glutathionine S-transferase n=1 Tax=Salmonella enterica subsp. enterica serovar Wandsworth str. A4-580 TaxID=913086 RepID=G5SC88_SALET|nr:glutathionine S-transferase [Salmonella enterica subsp. enterica serovar Wandsworth str. A4-580]
MKLFYKPGACSLASHITLREIGKDFTLDGVDLAKKRLENGDDYLAVNPKGQVPALLLDDGTLLTEGVAIMQYLADSVPDRQLLAPTAFPTASCCWRR